MTRWWRFFIFWKFFGAQPKRVMLETFSFFKKQNRTFSKSCDFAENLFSKFFSCHPTFTIYKVNKRLKDEKKNWDQRGAERTKYFLDRPDICSCMYSVTCDACVRPLSVTCDAFFWNFIFFGASQCKTTLRGFANPIRKMMWIWRQTSIEILDLIMCNSCSEAERLEPEKHGD